MRNIRHKAALHATEVFELTDLLFDIRRHRVEGICQFGEFIFAANLQLQKKS